MMAINIKIQKHSVIGDTGYYKIDTQDFGGAHFYIGIDKKNKNIKFYISDPFNDPIKMIDCKNENAPIGSLPGVDISILGRVVMRALKVMKGNDFPEYISYEA